MKDLYKILNIDKNSSSDDIKKSYRKLAFKYHPDKNKSKESSEKFKDISEAYEILSNKDKKNLYDNFGYSSLNNNEFINPLELFQSLFNVDFTQMSENINSNIFVFSDLSMNPFNKLKHKMNYIIECTIDELYHGTQREFSILHMTKKGKKNTNYIINIKRGTQNNESIIVKEGGNYISDLDVVEDLVIIIKELNHSKYKRKNNDLYIEEKITLCEALCGLELTVDHLDGPLNISINNIIKPNQVYQVYGKGMPIKYEENTLKDKNNNLTFGNLIIDLDIVFPESISDENIIHLSKILKMESNNQRKFKSSKDKIQGYYFKNKNDIVKEIINEKENENDDIGCIQQ